jgi:hypothetical protein
MESTKTLAATAALIVSAMVVCHPSVAQSATQCVALPDGVEYRSYLPDHKRFVYIAVKVIPNTFPSIYVIVDKSYDAPRGKVVVGDPSNQWAIDRSRPMIFSSDKVRVAWKYSGTFDFATDWLSAPDPTDVVQTIRGLEPAERSRFQGYGASDANSFAFQTSLAMLHIPADEFDVTVPAVSYDGATATLPVIHFVRDGKAITTKC